MQGAVPVWGGSFSLRPSPVDWPTSVGGSAQGYWSTPLSYVGETVALLIGDSGGDLAKVYARADVRRLFVEAGWNLPGDLGREIKLAIGKYGLLEGDRYGLRLTTKALEVARSGYPGLHSLRRRGPRF